MRARATLVIVVLALAACGAPARQVVEPVAPPPVRADEPLDWATLLPLDTLGFLRIDLERLRRSPHHAALEPLFRELLGEVEDDALRESFASVLERTDLMLVAILPAAAEDGEEELLLFARGDYRPDEIEQLDASAPERSVPIDVRGQRVWVAGTPGDPTTVSQLRPDTLVLTGTRAHMEGVIARTHMASGAPRWPRSVRGLIEELEIERATIGLAIARQSFGGDEEGDGLLVSIAGRADLDGPLSLDVTAELDDPSTAAMVAVIIEGMVRAVGSSEDSLPLRHLAERARVEASGTRVRASVRADAETTGRAVPALIELFRDGVSAEDDSLLAP